MNIPCSVKALALLLELHIAPVKLRNQALCIGVVGFCQLRDNIRLQLCQSVSCKPDNFRSEHFRLGLSSPSLPFDSRHCR